MNRNRTTRKKKKNGEVRTENKNALDTASGACIFIAMLWTVWMDLRGGPSDQRCICCCTNQSKILADSVSLFHAVLKKHKVEQQLCLPLGILKNTSLG